MDAGDEKRAGCNQGEKPMGGVRLVDSHVHLDLVARHFPERIKWWKEHDCAVISWSFGGNITSVKDLENYFLRQSRAVEKAAWDQGLVSFFLAGIHPRDIPDDLQPQQVEGLLAPLMKHPLCLGIGEIGLETGSRREQIILEVQLEAARRILPPGLRIGLHTPRSKKEAITGRLLALLEQFQDLHPRMVIDHCSEKTMPLVLEKGLRAGVTLSPVKTSLEALGEMIERQAGGIEKIMCNTDSGSEFFEDLVMASRSGLFDRQLAERIFCRNAADFFGLALGDGQDGDK